MYLTNDTTLMDMSLNTDKQKIEKKGLLMSIHRQTD
jgi:hypothetical protein